MTTGMILSLEEASTRFVRLPGMWHWMHLMIELMGVKIQSQEPSGCVR
jgi:hypothetical protein